MTTGIIFDIQRCSLRDGPGVRTTVFLKGCPLRCLWCHNPESVSFSPQLSFDPTRCADCLACVRACSHGVQQQHNERHVLDRARCQVCGGCVEVCLNDALKVVGARWSDDAVLCQVERDADYYRRSGGGMTLSGGEPLAQVDFTLALLEGARARDIHTCIETSGFAPQSHYARLWPLVELFLFDYKATDPAAHRLLTGVSNELILANLEFLYRCGANIVLRCPLVPGVNDTAEHLAGIAAIAARYPRLTGIEIMAYHEMGREKGPRVGREAALPDLKSADEETQTRWLAALRELGCHRAVIG